MPGTQTQFGLICARLDEVRAAEGRQEVVECRLVDQIHDAEFEGGSILIGVRNRLSVPTAKSVLGSWVSRNAAFAIDALTRTSIPLVSMTGKAGTGKTLLALASAIQVKKNYRQIYVARPVVPLSNKDMGFLPGDIESKLAPYMQPLWDNLTIIQSQYPEADKQYKQIDQMIEEKKLVIKPLSYIRGRSLQKVFFIVDEAQNLTPHEIKTIITRAGEGVKIVLTGDIYQIDHPYLDSQSNGVSYLIDHFKGEPLYSHINLEKGERSELAELASNLL